MAIFIEPQKWAQTLGKDADVTAIPDTAGDTDPSIDKIFPSVFSIPLANGGRAIPRSVLNGLFKLVGDSVYYMQNGGLWSYNSAFDYAVGRVVLYTDGNLYKCIQANSSTAPKAPTNSDYWSKIALSSDISSFANTSLSNLNTTGQAILDGKANTSLSNLSTAGQDILDRKAYVSLSNLNDTGNIVISRNVMPSAVYDDLTLGASGTSYTAPSNGYVYIAKTSTASGQYINIQSGGRLSFQTASATGDQTIRFFVPIAKGVAFTVNYNLGGTTQTFRFVYAIGSVSEKV